jgi:ADP-ribose pyrophosphatase YjhB (NUDIX family)
MADSKNEYSLSCTAGVVARDDLGRVLLIQRADDLTWGLPGGHVEVGETWSQAALRECLEETGWIARITGIFGVYSNPKSQLHTYPNGQRAHFMSVVFEAELIEKVAQPSNKSAAVEFFNTDQLRGAMFPADMPVFEALASRRTGPFID